MQDEKITGDEARAGSFVKNGRILKMLVISVTLPVVGFLIVGYVNGQAPGCHTECKWDVWAILSTQPAPADLNETG